MCDVVMPSSSHLLWACPATAEDSLNNDVRLPRDVGEERLLCVTLDVRPPPAVPCRGPPRVDPDFVSWLLDAVRWARDGVLIVGTDGGSEPGVAASWAVAHDTAEYLGDMKSLSRVVHGEDDASFSVEVVAVFHLVCALGALAQEAAAAAKAAAAAAGAVPAGCIVMASLISETEQRLFLSKLIAVIDCEGLQDFVSGLTVPKQRWEYHLAIRKGLDAVRALGIGVDLSWVSSHGKRAPRRWCPHPGSPKRG